MHAAIKTLEDTLLIRRLQARELGFDKETDRHAAIMQDIESLERGLKTLKAEAGLPAITAGATAGQKSAIINQKPAIDNSHQGASCSTTAPSR